jgi:hypothetical protein
MNLMAYRTSHRLINVVVLRDIFGGKTLNAVSGFGATVREERHVKNSFPLHVTKWIDLDQSPKRATAKFKRGQRDGKEPVPQKETPTEVGVSPGSLAVFSRKQGDFPRKTGRRLSTNGQSLRGIRDLDHFLQKQITERKQGGTLGNRGRPLFPFLPGFGFFFGIRWRRQGRFAVGRHDAKANGSVPLGAPAARAGRSRAREP